MPREVSSCACIANIVSSAMLTAKATEEFLMMFMNSEVSGGSTRVRYFGDYELLSEIARGGMGVVYAAYDPELDRKIALKLVLPGAGSDSAGRTRLLREAQALARLSHPNVVAVHDVGTHGERVWIAMEFVAGRPLADVIRDEKLEVLQSLRPLNDTSPELRAAARQDRWMVVGFHVAAPLVALALGGWTGLAMYFVLWLLPMLTVIQPILRLRGYLVPPTTGTYVFWLAGDDNCQLWLSSDRTAAAKVKKRRSASPTTPPRSPRRRASSRRPSK